VQTDPRPYLVKYPPDILKKKTKVLDNYDCRKIFRVKYPERGENFGGKSQTLGI
jgi:hypothetical protein